jgi:Mg2+ and Co2+ transporter CorA
LERDKRTEQLSLADKTAIAAALQAQKEAAGATNDSIIAVITKMDASFTKLFDQMTNLLSAMQKNTDEKIGDIKQQMSQISSRIDRREGVTSAMDPITSESIAWMKARLEHGKTFEDATGGAAAQRNQSTNQTMMILAVFATLMASSIGVAVGHFMH